MLAVGMGGSFVLGMIVGAAILAWVLPCKDCDE